MHKQIMCLQDYNKSVESVRNLTNIWRFVHDNMPEKQSVIYSDDIE